MRSNVFRHIEHVLKYVKIISLGYSSWSDFFILVAIWVKIRSHVTSFKGMVHGRNPEYGFMLERNPETIPF